MTARSRVIDLRGTLGIPSGYVDQPTFSIPHDCVCTWTVIRPGPGWACVSRLRFQNAICRHRHVPQEAARG